MDINTFVRENQGKIVPDPWGGYKGQCVSLVKQWIVANGWEMRKGNAINWQYNGYGQYRWIKNQVWTIPKPGDMAVFQVGSFGHIGIVVGANVLTMDVFNQNWPSGAATDPARITRFNYRNPKCIGFLRHI